MGDSFDASNSELATYRRAKTRDVVVLIGELFDDKIGRAGDDSDHRKGGGRHFCC